MTEEEIERLLTSERFTRVVQAIVRWTVEEAIRYPEELETLPPLSDLVRDAVKFSDEAEPS